MSTNKNEGNETVKMKILLTDFEWIIRTDVFNDLLTSEQIVIEELDSGLEATVYKIQSKKWSLEFVLKLWNKRAPGDARNQYHLLEKLDEIGLPVSKPFALGRNNHGEYGLITSHDGMPLLFESYEIEHMRAIATLMVKVHNTDIIQLDGQISKHDDFIGYFLQLTEEHSDIAQLIKDILSGVTISADCLIHGDFNLGNIVVSHDKYTIIDWTNAQIGDRRYDFAWASFLILIYNGAECYREFYDVYTGHIPIDLSEIYIFEMIACLRWIWLSRIAPIPIHNNTMSRVKEFIHNHKELQAVHMNYD